MVQESPTSQMPFWQPDDLPGLLNSVSEMAAWVIGGAAVLHIAAFFGLWIWYRRDLRVITGSLEDFTRGLSFRSVLGRSAPLPQQIDAFVADIRDVVADSSRKNDRLQCLQRMHILDEKRGYLDSLGFETSGNLVRTMIEAYPLAGVLGTIIAIGAVLQGGQEQVPAAASALSGIIGRFGDAIWSTFAGLTAAIFLMFLNSLLEPRFHRLTECRRHVRDVVAEAKRQLGIAYMADKNPAGRAAAPESSRAAGESPSPAGAAAEEV